MTKKEKQEYERQWRENNRVHVNSYLKAYRKKNKERDKDHIAEYSEQYRQNNKNKFLRYSKKFQTEKPNAALLIATRTRAKKNNIPFNLKLSDIVIPSYCPILNIPLFRGDGKVTDNSPSLDRIIPEMGYYSNNIQVISQLANRIKNNASLEQLVTVGKWAKKAIET